MSKASITKGLYDPRSGGQAIRIESLSLGRKPFEPARTNYFSVYLIESGAGTFWADASQFSFGPESLLFFVPYQHIRFAPNSSVQGEVVQFHANFLCVETFHAEVGCSGILFNDPYGIVPFVANSPFMSFFYADGENYKAHKNPEGVLNAENRAWHEANHTYEFAYGLGTVIVLYGLLLCLHPWLPQAAAVGSFLVFVMSFVTLSFLITTPEAWVRRFPSESILPSAKTGPRGFALRGAGHRRERSHQRGPG